MPRNLRWLVVLCVLLAPCVAFAQQAVNITQVGSATEDLPTETTLLSVDTTLQSIEDLLSAPITVQGTVTTTSDDQQSDDDNISYSLTNPVVTALLYCDNSSNWERCPSGDGNSGAATAQTSRVVEAWNTGERYISVGSTEDENEICAAACTLVSITASNNHASANAFIKCANLTASNTTPGSSTIVYDLLVPFGLANNDYPNMRLTTALTCWIVLGEADNDVAEVAANDVRYTIRTK